MYGHAYGEPPDKKSEAAEEYRKAVTNKTGTKIKARLQFKLLAANRAIVRHGHSALKMVWIGIDKQIALPAMRAFSK